MSEATETSPLDAVGSLRVCGGLPEGFTRVRLHPLHPLNPLHSLCWAAWSYPNCAEDGDEDALFDIACRLRIASGPSPTQVLQAK
jgi:hypothetical protein